ncbi:MAG TPA: protein gvpG [Halococcus sp.]|nr:protein gvpG [Halococcus sp.]
MFLVDDLLFRPIISIANVIHSMAIEEMYDIEGIRDDIKENRLLFEIGERTEAEYETRRRELETRLDVAQKAHETLTNRVEVKQ